MSHIGVSSSSGLVTRSNSIRRSSALSALSDRELLARVKALVAHERATTLEILVQLNEVERRRLHLGLGYPSLFEYCVRHLGYSSSAASRRIHSARCIRDYPEVYGLLERNEVNLSSVSLVASILTRENNNDLLNRIRNKSQKEVEAIVADYRPPVALRDRARPVCVAVAASPVIDTQGLPPSGSASVRVAGEHRGSLTLAANLEEEREKTSTQRTSGCDYSRSGSEKTPNTAADSVGGPPRLERKFQVQFLASERFMKKFERVKALLSNKDGKPSYEAVLEAALDEFLKDHDPERRRQRREERREKAESGQNSAKFVEGKTVRPQKTSRYGRSERAEEHSRHIPASTRDAVFKRDKDRCTYVGSNGVRCGAKHHLQIDHVVPYARGGTNGVHNLRLLCERHNKLEAERVYGSDKMTRFRARE